MEHHHQDGAIRADLDGIRALGDLMHRQSGYAAQSLDYLNQHCQATGAFDGVIAMFRDTFARAFADAAEGLRISRDADRLVADRFRATAANYESADRASYDRLAQIARAHGWEVPPYRTAGSGSASAKGGVCPTVAPAASGDRNRLERAWEAVQDGASAVDGAVSGTLDSAMELHEVVDGGVPATTTVGGRVVFAEDLRRANLVAEAGGWAKVEADVDPFDRALKPFADDAKFAAKVMDPVGALKEKISGAGSDWAHDRAHGRVDSFNPESAHRLNQGMSWAKDTVGLYSTTQAFVADPTMGLKGAAEELGSALADESRYRSIASSDRPTAMRDALGQDGR